MLYTDEMIKNLGYESVEDFIADYVNNHTNCCVRYMPNGVYLDCDFDSKAYYSTNHTSISTNTYNKNFKINFNK